MRKLVIAGILGAAGTIGMSIALVSATPNVNPANGHRYEVVSSPFTTWDAAEALARARGSAVCPAYLATVTSQNENDFLVATFGAGALNTKWLGGIQPPGSVEPAGGWTWITGEAWSYTNWGGAEPNNQGGNEEALVFFFNNGTWNDAPRGFTGYSGGGYVVEYDCLEIVIDVKPGSDTNSFNNNERGVIPVAILTTATFDAATVDPATVAMDGAAVRLKGKSGNAGSLEDVDGDGDLDLVVQILDTAGMYATGDAVATVSAFTFDGAAVKGTDSIRLVP